MDARTYHYLTQERRRIVNRALEKRHFNLFDRLCFEVARIIGWKRD